MLLLLGRWIFLYYGILNNDEKKHKDDYYIDSNGKKQRKKMLREIDLRDMSIEEIDAIEKKGIYIIPLEYEEELDSYRHKKFFEKPENFGMFNYNRKNMDSIDSEELKSKQEKNLNAQKTLE